MRVTIPDDLFGECERRAAADMMPVEAWIEAQLRRTQDYPVRDRVLVIGATAREQLEHILHGGMLLDEDDLVGKVDRLAVLKIGELTTNFSPGQWEEFARRCARAGVDPQDEAQRIVTKVSELFFDHV